MVTVFVIVTRVQVIICLQVLRSKGQSSQKIFKSKGQTKTFFSCLSFTKFVFHMISLHARTVFLEKVAMVLDKCQTSLSHIFSIGCIPWLDGVNQLVIHYRPEIMTPNL